jgi:hypothetical protein
MEQKTGISSLYDEFFQSYEAEIRLSCSVLRPNSTYKQSYTLMGSDSTGAWPVLPAGHRRLPDDQNSSLKLPIQ